MEKAVLLNFLEDLRRRLVIIFATLLTCSLASFAFSERIRWLLLSPAERAASQEGATLQLIFLTPSEALLANMRLALIAGAMIALPLILYQVVALLMTAAGKKRRTAVQLTLVMYLLFVLGLSFAYFVVLPFALAFFIGFSSADLEPSFSVARYISFTAAFIFYFGLVFQLPVVFWFLGSMGLVNTATLRRNRKFALLAVVIFAAVLTPPDPFSQLLMAIPLMLLFEMGIIMVYFATRSRRRLQEADGPV